ncbi:MAG: NAD(P)H-dependent oxidoreductase [Candidatus Saccharibacteria bacterium]
MSNILVVTGSARKGRIADTILEHVQSELKAHAKLNVTVADLKEINLPFFDGEHVPMSPDFKPTNENVLAWTKLVDEADGVILVMPEYNHSMTAIQKNALDWIYKEWNGKPLSIIGYGWSGASLAHVTAKEVLSNLKTKTLPTSAHLHFMKQINTDGSIIDEAGVSEAIKLTVDELVGELAAEPQLTV